MNINTLKQLGTLGLTLIALLLIIGLGNSAYANNADEIRQNNSEVQVDPQLLAEMNENGRAGYLIYFSDKADLTPAYDMDWEARGHFVVNALQAAAESSQKNVRAYLDSADTEYQHFWIDNIIVVKSSNLTVLNTLLSFNEIAFIQAETENFLIEPVAATNTADPEIANNRAPEPNLTQVKATNVWALGIRGQGTVIANIDSGVRHTHQALVNQYRGNLGGGNFNHNYNWLDPDGGTVVPTDANGHGTHVMGTMVGYDGGANEIGVAPDSEWIACRGCLTSSCPQTALLACAQWAAAPHPIGNPGSPDPSKRPMAVNNSWGNCQQSYNGWYQGAVDSWHAAGIIPVFANGNASNCGFSSPPGLNTVGNPGRYGNVTGVGSSGTSNGLYAPHSNWGPTDNLDTVNPEPGWADLKPQVIAPGVSIRSSLNSGDTAYGSAGWTGTSMSAPHVTGMIALMWQAAPCLIGDYAATETIIEQTATPIMYNDLGTGARSPNYATGWGEIDVLAAVQQAQSMCGPSGSIEGLVTDTVTTSPLAGVTIEATLDITTTKTATTDAAGEYVIATAPEGFYDMTASAFGYLPGTMPGVQVISGTVTFVNFVLMPAPASAISGIVTDVNTGWPLYAQIAVDGVPGSPFWTDPATGAYSITLPEGSAYDFTVSAFVAGYLPESFSVGPLAGNTTVNVELDVNAAVCVAPGYVPGAGSGDFYDFEANDGGFVGTVDWEWGTNYNYTGAGCDGANYPPPAPYSGVGMWATVLNGCHANTGTFSNLSFSADLTGLSSALLQWWDWYDVFETFDYGEVYVNNTLVYDRATSYVIPTAWEQHEVDLTAYVGGTADIEFRMFATTVVNRAGWYIDDVLIGQPSCTPEAGGLAVGNVYDDNSGDPLVGATVATDDNSVATVATPLDANVDDGFYTLFMAEGEGDIVASMPGGYITQTVTLDIADGTTVSQDFWLPAGWLTVDPGAVEVNLAMGSSFTMPVSIANMGASAADYSLTTYFLYEDFEGSFPPDGWQIVDNGGACVWQRNDELPRANFAGGDGYSAAADSDACGSGTTMNSELHTPSLNLIGVTAATLEFVASYRHLASSSFRVHVSDDGGANWDTLLTWSASVDPTGPGVLVSLDLTPYAGSDDVIISFHYNAPGWHWYAQVDQVRLVVDATDWFSISPTEGSLDGGATEWINAAFDATGLTTGVYSAIVSLSDDTPYPDQIIPVTLTVVETAVYGLNMSPDTAADSGDRGEMVAHTLTLTNTGTVIDTFNLAASGHTWAVNHAPSVIINAGQSAEVTVWVTVPVGAAYGATDSVTITATSMGDPTQTASAVLTTMAEWELTLLYLPVIVR